VHQLYPFPAFETSPLPLQGYQYSWCVDPLDGTKEFLKRNGQFTVNIALLRVRHAAQAWRHCACSVQRPGSGTRAACAGLGDVRCSIAVSRLQWLFYGHIRPLQLDAVDRVCRTGACAMLAGQPTSAGRGGGACGCELLLRCCVASAGVAMLPQIPRTIWSLHVDAGPPRPGSTFAARLRSANRRVQGTGTGAAGGQGAEGQRPGSEAQRLQAAEVDLSAPGLVVVGSASHLTAETQARAAGLDALHGLDGVARAALSCC